MKFSEAVITGLSKYIEFSGRASRSEFWYFRLFTLFVAITLEIARLLFSDLWPNDGFTYFSIAIIIAIAIPDASAQVRRLHDVNTSGLWLLPIYFFIPLILAAFAGVSGNAGRDMTMAQEQGLLMLMVIWIALFLGVFITLLFPGTKGDNKYGKDPLIPDTGERPTKKSHLTHHKSASNLLNATTDGGGRKVLCGNTARKEVGAQQAYGDTLPDDVTPSRLTAQAPKDADHPLENSFSILLEHDDEVRAMIDSVSGAPKNVKQEILSEVLNTPGGDLKSIRDTTILKALGRPDMKWNGELEVLVQTFKNAKPESVDKFFEVFPILSHRMSTREIRNKILVLPKSDFYVQTAAGRDMLVTQYGDDIFEFNSLNSGKVTLNSLNEVFEYLGMPEKQRFKKKSW